MSDKCTYVDSHQSGLPVSSLIKGFARLGCIRIRLSSNDHYCHVACPCQRVGATSKPELIA
jgi:hypothetical protein